MANHTKFGGRDRKKARKWFLHTITLKSAAFSNFSRLNEENRFGKSAGCIYIF